MNSADSDHNPWRFTLAEILSLLALVAVGCAALRYAGEVWATALSAVVFAVFMIAATLAVVGRGALQSRAVGTSIFIAIYGVLFWAAPSAGGIGNSQSSELHPGTGHLPTSKALKPLYEVIVKRMYIDDSGNTTASLPPGVGFLHRVEVPQSDHFMAVGHALWAILLGYLGSRVGYWAYTRRTRTSNEP